jgi:asparagine synthase (glutamine-hydrolysing)
MLLPIRDPELDSKSQPSQTYRQIKIISGNFVATDEDSHLMSVRSWTVCGIGGIFNTRGNPVGNAGVYLTLIQQAISHRGPDNLGQWQSPNESVNFAHSRLAINDLSPFGNQPIHRGTRFTMVFNGEVYNYKELAQNLRNAGVEIRGSSDSEVLLALYHEYGKDMLAMIKGMFAFVIWDSHEEKLFCARDRLGMKPFYFGYSRENFYFASEIKALLAVSGDSALDESVLAELEMYQFLLSDRTPFVGIRELRAGHFLEIRRGKSNLASYWSPNSSIESQHPSDSSDNLAETLENSVSEHLVSDVPISSFVSGGKDSSLIYGIASSLRGSPLHGFHGTFPGFPDFSEQIYAQDLVSMHGGKLEVVPIGSRDFFEALPATMWSLDFPLGGPGSVAQKIVSDRVSKNFKVALGGQGADEILGGYARHAALIVSTWIKPPNRQEARGNDLSGPKISSLLGGFKGYNRYITKHLQLHVGKPIAHQYERLLNRVSREPKDFTRHEQSARERFLEQFGRVQIEGSGPDWFSGVRAFDLQFPLQALLQIDDRVSMCHGVETRLPFLDHKFVEAGLGLTIGRLVGGGTFKDILKKQMAHLLPESVSTRRDKMGFPVPMAQWFDSPHDRSIILRSIDLEDFLPELTTPNISGLGPAASLRELWNKISTDTWRTLLAKESATMVKRLKENGLETFRFETSQLF